MEAFGKPRGFNLTDFLSKELAEHQVTLHIKKIRVEGRIEAFKVAMGKPRQLERI